MKRDLFKQKPTNQPFLFEVILDPVGKLVETVMPFKKVDTIENYSESLDDNYDELSQAIPE